jgi:hypothetical protein
MIAILLTEGSGIKPGRGSFCLTFVSTFSIHAESPRFSPDWSAKPVAGNPSLWRLNFWPPVGRLITRKPAPEAEFAAKAQSGGV